MKKRTFLGFDVTPRRALWQEINNMKRQLEDSVVSLRSSLHHAEEERLEALKRCAALEDRLSCDNPGHIAHDVAEPQTLPSDAPKSLVEAIYLLQRRDAEIAELRARLARYNRPKDIRGRFCKKEEREEKRKQPHPAPASSPRTVRLLGLDWMTENLSGAVVQE